MKRSAKICVLFGTRPEIIKLAPVIRRLERERRGYFLLHTGQHHSYGMDRIFFKELELPEPRYKLSVHQTPSLGHAEHTAKMLTAVEKILMAEKPSAVLVQGDTNSVLAGAMVASKMGGVRVGHVEAGLRSYDRSMPEEINRVMADHLSDDLFAPTALAKRTLLGEGIASKKIHVTGNTIVDAVKQNLAIARRSRRPMPAGLAAGERYLLMTMHRQENVDIKDRLASIFTGVERVVRHFKLPLIFPAHPRAVGRMKQFRISPPTGMRLIEPTGFMDFLRLEASAHLILSDSGGVQEEACILGVPCVTLRTTTERPETVTVGANLIAGRKPEAILAAAKRMAGRRRSWANPFGDGRASERIVSVTARAIGA